LGRDQRLEPLPGDVRHLLFRMRGVEDEPTLGFGRGQLEEAAALMFGRALPGEVELDMDACMSYAQWLRRWSASSP